MLETDFVRGRINPTKYHALRSSLTRTFINELHDLVFASPGKHVSLRKLDATVAVISLREPTLREFLFLQYRTISSRRHSRRTLRCFVGHRFHPNVEASLRFNLRYLLEPYHIRLVWAGLDFRTSNLFDSIIRQIKSVDFCVFDNLGTLNKPNVYIEAGIAYALEKPFIFCEYAGRSNRVLDTGSIPSDLSGLLRVQYRSYRDLCEQLYFGLPDFLKDNGLR